LPPASERTPSQSGISELGGTPAPGYAVASVSPATTASAPHPKGAFTWDDDDRATRVYDRGERISLHDLLYGQTDDEVSTTAKLEPVALEALCRDSMPADELIPPPQPAVQARENMEASADLEIPTAPLQLPRPRENEEALADLQIDVDWSEEESPRARADQPPSRKESKPALLAGRSAILLVLSVAVASLGLGLLLARHL
jgi:hypothetical protein